MSQPDKKERDPKPEPLVKGWIDDYRFAESVLVDDKPAFLIVDTRTHELSVSDRIAGRFRPLGLKEFGYVPFAFTSAEIQELWSSATSRDDLLDSILEVVQQYVDMPLREQILLTGDVFLTYCMEWINTVHFLFSVGSSGSGKTNLTSVPKEVGYRCFAVGELTPANIYNFLGTAEEGCGCLCEDEAQDLGSEKGKMKIYKNAYSKGRKIPKMDMFRKREQLYYNTFCMVFFSGEALPEDKAFMQRTVVIYMVRGNPKDNIKDPKYPEWKDEHIIPLRKKLLLWKLHNIENGLPRVDSGLTGRDQELFEYFLSVFAGTKHEAEAGKVVEHYVNQRQETIKDSPEAAVLGALMQYMNGEKQIEFLQFWQFLTKSGVLQGEFLNNAEKTFILDHSDEVLNHNSVPKMLVEKFVAKKRSAIKIVDGNRKKVTYYVFDEEILKTLAEKYHINDP